MSTVSEVPVGSEVESTPDAHTREPVAVAAESGFGRSLLIFAAIAGSLVLLFSALALPSPERASFLFGGEQKPAARAQSLGLVAAAMAASLVAGLVAKLVFRARIVEPARRWATILSPLSLAFVVPALFAWQPAQRNPLGYLLVLTLFGFSARALCERSLREIPGLLQGLSAGIERLPRYAYASALLIATLGYTAYTSYYTIINHRLIGTTAFDLGIYDNLMFNAMRGNFFHSPVLFGPGDRSYIAGHAEYAMLLFVPFYAIKPHAETMLIIQSAVLGASAIPLYMLARVYVSRIASLIVGVSYLMFAPLHGPHFYDFHWLPLGIFFYFWLFYGLATRRNWLSYLMVLVLFAMREDIAVTLALFGGFLFFTGFRQRFGLVLAALSAVWFVINKFVIMHLAGSWWFENMYSELFADGKPSYGSVIATLLTNPIYSLTTFVRAVKLEYGLHMLAPLAFLPLRRPVFLLLLIPGALFTLMTTGYPPSTQISFQYTTHWIPYLFLGLVLGLALTYREHFGAERRAAALAVLALVVMSHSYDFGAILQRESFTGGFRRITFEMDAKAHKRYEDLMRLVARIPGEASVAATEALNPHISAREEAYSFRSDFGPVDYVLVSQFDMSSENRKLMNDAFQARDYGLSAKAGEFYLFKKGLVAAETDSALRTLGLRPRPVRN